jgi:DeoR/GlpR family transcriptional regulator of sugar metabolism
MDKKSERLKYIRNFIEMKKAVTIDEFFPHISYCEKTLRRDIKNLRGITSYTHRGKLITLPNIPIFDKNGLLCPIYPYSTKTVSGFTKILDSQNIGIVLI